MSTSHVRDELTVVRQVRRSETVQPYISTANLKWILCFTGNQWRCLSTGVIWSRREAPVTSRAAAFCTDCSRWIRPPEMSYSDMTRMTELTSSWRHPTTNAQSFVTDAAGSRPNDRRQWRGQTSLSHCQWPLLGHADMDMGPVFVTQPNPSTLKYSWPNPMKYIPLHVVTTVMSQHKILQGPLAETVKSN